MKQGLAIGISVAALVIATFGSTPLGAAAQDAVSQLVPRNSVGSQQLKRNAVTAAKLSPNAVRSGHVLDGSLLTVDFKAGQIPQGPKGDKGDRGEAGATNVVVRTVTCGIALAAGESCNDRAMCQAGERAVGGGGGFPSSAGGVTLKHSFPVEADQSSGETGDTPVGWEAAVENNALSPRDPTIFVVCARP